MGQGDPTDRSAPTGDTHHAPGQGKPSQQDADKGPDLIHANPQWNLSLIVISCVVGALLLLIGIAAEMFALLDGILSTTFIVSALAIVFGAFGSQATVRYKGWIIAGVAATALIFLFAIDYLRRDSYAQVELVTSQKPTTDIRAGRTLIKGAVDKDGENLRTTFFILYKDIIDADPRFEIDMHQDESSERPRILICFAKNKLIHRFARSAKVIWWLDEKDMKIVEGKDRPIGSRNDCPGFQSGPDLSAISLGISSAYAQSRAEIDAMIKDLLSDNTDVRRLTRDQLAEVGPSAVRPLMDAAVKMTLSNDRLAFRMQVGAAVAIDRMIARDPKSTTAAAVHDQFTASDYDALIQWSLNRDQSLLGPTLRILASTADLPTLQRLMDVVAHQDNENIIYNTAWILRQSAQRYSSDARTLAAIKDFARSLRPRSPGDKTTNFLNQTLAIGP